MTAQGQSWPQTPDRSQLLRAGLPHAPRRRPYALRRAIVLPLAALLVLSIWAFGWKILPVTPLTRPVYWLHDAVWLPLWGRLSTWLFPWSLVWLFPVAGLLALAGLEYLTRLRPLRRLQIRLLTILARRRAGAALLVGADRVLRRFGLRAGLARAVARGLVGQSRDAAFRGAPYDARQMFHLAALSLRLGTGSVAEQIEAVELVLFQASQDSHEIPYRGLMAVLPRLPSARTDWQHWFDLARVPPPGAAAEIAASARALQELAADPPEAALLILRAASLAAATGDRRSLLPFQSWAQLAATAPPETVARLAEAAALIRFEDWAAAAERTVAAALGQARKGLVEMALPGATGLPEQGERFAGREALR